jgi:hypothetical protein
MAGFGLAWNVPPTSFHFSEELRGGSTARAEP